MTEFTKTLFLETIARFARGLSLASLVAAVLHQTSLGATVLVVLSIAFFSAHLALCYKLGKGV